MNDLAMKEIQMTSLDLAEATGKEHKNILRDIRNELEELEEKDRLIFEPMLYLDSYKREQQGFKFGREGAMQLALKYDALTRRKVIVKLGELEKVNQPTGSNLLALAVLEAQRMLTQKDEVIAIMAPKAEFFDAVAGSKDAIDIGSASKVLNMGIGRNKMFEKLRDLKVLMNNNQPYQKYIDMGYFRTVEQKYETPSGETHISIKTLVYQKGLDYIRRLLTK